MKPSNKLTVERQTLRLLTTDALRGIQAGASDTRKQEPMPNPW